MSDLYKKSGVDLDKAAELTNLLKAKAPKSSIGAFAGVLNFGEDYLVSTVDGIGTKIIPLLERKMYSGIAQDLCAMNLNDLVTTGAKPLGFCDYISVNKIDPDVVSKIVGELKNTLENFGCELQGGETSELNILNENSMDICGFAFGSVEKSKLLDINNVQAGDVVIGLCSSGPHSNGFSLIRKFYEEKKLSDEEFEQCLKPTYIYVNEILELCWRNLIKSAANITGGGIVENLHRAIREPLFADLDYSAIPRQPIFIKLQALSEDEAWRIFNMGVGFCVICEKNKVQEVTEVTKRYSPFVFGEVKND